MHHYYINRTITTVPSSPPLNFSVETTTPWSLLFSWEPPYPEHWNGILLGYVINVTTVDTGTTIKLYSDVDTVNLTSSIFLPYTDYRCSIATFTQVGIGPYSTDVTIQTLQYCKNTASMLLYL